MKVAKFESPNIAGWVLMAAWIWRIRMEKIAGEQTFSIQIFVIS